MGNARSRATPWDPTRFIDLTTNPLVALYFATRDTKKDKDGKPTDSAVYVLIQEPPLYADIAQSKISKIADKESDKKPSAVPSANTDPYGDLGLPEDTAPGGVESIDSIPSDRKDTSAPAQHTQEDFSPFTISTNIIYDPPHFSPRIRAQDGVLLACSRPLEPLEEKDYLEIVIAADAHEEIRRRLDLYGVFHKQLFPDLDGMAKWLKFHEFECQETDKKAS